MFCRDTSSLLMLPLRHLHPDSNGRVLQIQRQVWRKNHRKEEEEKAAAKGIAQHGDASPR